MKAWAYIWKYPGRRIDSVMALMPEPAAMKTTLITQWAMSPPCGDLYLMSSSLFPLARVWLFFQVLDHERILACPMAC